MARVLCAVLMAGAFALAGCSGGGGGYAPSGPGSCLFSGVTQLVYPIPGSTSVPDAFGQVVFATSQLFSYSYDVLINTDPNPNHAASGTAAFFQRIDPSQVPSPSATPTISNPYYESASFSGSFPHATYYLFFNDSAVPCTAVSAGSFTTQ